MRKIKTWNNNKPLNPKTPNSKENDTLMSVKFGVDTKVTECGSVKYVCDDLPILKKNVYLRVKRDRIQNTPQAWKQGIKGVVDSPKLCDFCRKSRFLSAIHNENREKSLWKSNIKSLAKNFKIPLAALPNVRVFFFGSIFFPEPSFVFMKFFFSLLLREKLHESSHVPHWHRLSTPQTRFEPIKPGWATPSTPSRLNSRLNSTFLAKKWRCETVRMDSGWLRVARGGSGASVRKSPRMVPNFGWRAAAAKKKIVVKLNHP